jgi:urease accessory protein
MPFTKFFVLMSSGVLISTFPAAAHSGAAHASTFFAGVLHPLGGVDHMAAMFAVGAWSAVAGGARQWTWPVAFVLAMIGGALAGASGVWLPAVEPFIAATVVATGILLLLAVQLPVSLGMALVAIFALFHGHAHGTEAPASGLVPYLAGFALSTAALHLSGIAFAKGLQRIAGLVPVRAAGALIAATGVLLLVK